MSFASRYNRGNRWDIKTDNFEYKKISEVVAADGEDVPYKIFGVLYNPSGKFGESCAVILESCFVNLPKHMVETVKEILGSSEDVEDIKAGKVGIEFYSYQGSDGKPYYSANWIDL